MAGKRHDDGRVCLCDRPDGTCAGLAVQRLSRDRVRDLAEEIWTASSGFLPTVRPDGDPRSSRAGASAQTAYRRRREAERAAWRPGWAWRGWAVAGAALGRRAADRPDRRRLAGLAGGRGGGGVGLVAAALPPLARGGVWKRQAAMQRRTAAVLRPLGEEGYLVLHDITLPGWLDSLDHLVVGPTGVWVVESWRPRRPLPGGAAPPETARGLRGQAEAVAGVLAGWARVPVRPLLCLHSRWPVRSRPADGLRVAAPAQLPDIVRDGPTTQPTDLEQATSRLLDVLRPAA